MIENGGFARRSEINRFAQLHLNRLNRDYLNSIYLDNEFINYTIENINFSEKFEAISEIYTRLCNALCYDTEAFLSLGDARKLRECNEKHKDIDYINAINLRNNEVICSDFTVILAKIVNDKYPETEFFVGEKDTGMPGGVKHTFCVMKSDTCGYTELDPLKNFTNSDFLRVKLGFSAIGSGLTDSSGESIYKSYSEATSIHGVDVAIDMLQSNLIKSNLTPVESASYVKGALRAIMPDGMIRVKSGHSINNGELESTYELSARGQPISKMILTNNILQEI